MIDATRDRQLHQQEVRDFLTRHFHSGDWQFELPHGWGHESYFVHCDDQAYFVKLGVQIARYLVVASMGLTPPVLAAGQLGDGSTILVQPRIKGQTPARSDYRQRLEQFASVIDQIHHSPELKRLLPETPSELYRDAGLRSLRRIQQKWQRCRSDLSEYAEYIDESLEELNQRVGQFQGSGLAASHNDICNANWLLTPEGRLYLIDLDSMSQDDPALDIGATLWWYYPPELRQRFLETVGHADEAQFQFRMQARMAMHCLDIALPRQGSFDQLTPEAFSGWMVDFKAAFDGKENPQGYD